MNVTEVSNRLVTDLDSGKDGPVLILIGGIHGNELAGVSAIRTVSEWVSRDGVLKNGRVVGIVGNPEAVKRQVRYQDEDLNRIWLPEIVDEVRSQKESEIQSSERRDLKEILQILDPILADRSKRIIAVDLHSFSAHEGYFAITPESGYNEKLLNEIGIPSIFGIEKILPGTLLNYIHNFGHHAFAFEGGSHYSEDTLVNMVSFIKMLAMELEMCDTAESVDFIRLQKPLNNTLPSQMELVYQHIITSSDQFVMRPGFSNFQRVAQGDWLADDVNGKITAPCDGYILMPLYQNQGSDGFFLVAPRI
jgi:succinylglutamate desuccinylase